MSDRKGTKKDEGMGFMSFRGMLFWERISALGLAQLTLDKQKSSLLSTMIHS